MIENKPAIHISQEDFERLRLLAAARAKNGQGEGEAGSALRGELERAVVVPGALLPPGIVTVNSRVSFRDVISGEVETYVITWPDRTDAGRDRISVLAPIGTALIGYREGDEITWPTPGGTRQLEILKVEPVADEPRTDDSPQAMLEQLLYGNR
jgi:regulator of nucleoside diphosphate kinase